VEGFAHIYLKFIYIMDDRKPIIVYAIITEMNSNFHLVIITKKEPEK